MNTIEQQHALDALILKARNGHVTDAECHNLLEQVRADICKSFQGINQRQAIEIASYYRRDARADLRTEREDLHRQHEQRTMRMKKRCTTVRKIATKLKALIAINVVMITACATWAILKGIQCLNSY